MDPIREGMTGAMVEDVQERLASLGFDIDEGERKNLDVWHSTANAVARFRLGQNLPLSSEVDVTCWSALVDECYQIGDRTLYLRLPNFHGNDVRCLQNALNVLGFSCGEADGYYGPHTEGAVKMFQENVGMLADGIAFSDTFDALERLRHVWAGKPANGPHPQSGMGFARAALVLDEVSIALTAEDPIPATWPAASGTSPAPPRKHGPAPGRGHQCRRRRPSRRRARAGLHAAPRRLQRLQRHDGRGRGPGPAPAHGPRERPPQAARGSR